MSNHKNVHQLTPTGSPIHPTGKSLQSFAKGRLDGPDSIRLANHLLRDCDACDRVLSSEVQSTTLTERNPPSHTVLRWVRIAIALPPGRIAMFIENSEVPCAMQTALALEDLAAAGSSQRQHQPPTDLLGLAVDTLLGSGLHPMHPPAGLGDRETTTALVRIGSSLVREYLREGDLGEATRVLSTMTRATKNSEQDICTSDRVSVLVTTAAVLKGRSAVARLASEVETPDTDPDLLTTSQYNALVEAHQLSALVSDQQVHSRCALRLAEAILSGVAGLAPETVDLEDLATNLELHAHRLASAREHNLVLVAQRYLVLVYQLMRRWPLALQACEFVAEQHGRSGQLAERLKMVLESARILSAQGQNDKALERYREARRGLVLAGQPLEAAIAAVEAIGVRIRSGSPRRFEQSSQGENGLGAELSTIFASGGLDRPKIASLLLLRESYLQGTLTQDQIHTCLRILSPTVP